jgi:hypothetical protein
MYFAVKTLDVPFCQVGYVFCALLYPVGGVENCGSLICPAKTSIGIAAEEKMRVFEDVS